MTGLIKFSTDAASNDVAAPPILWTEGQPSNTYNNSARAMMAALACWHADGTGALSATGAASNALSLSTNQIFTGPDQNPKGSDFDRSFRLTFFVDAANTGPVTLNVDGTGARPLRRPGNIHMGPGDLQLTIPYEVIWAPTLGIYVLVGPDLPRPGQIATFGGYAAVPPGWLICDGAVVSRAAYAALFSAIGATYGAGDGSSTFAVPDASKRALFGPGGVLGGVGASGGSETVQLTADQMPNHTHSGSTSAAGGHDHGGSTGQAGQHSHGGGTGGAGGHNHNGTTGGGGGHSHSGTTDSAGEHGHNLLFTKVNTYGSGGNPGVADIGRTSGLGNTNAQADNAGSHAHNLAIQAVGDHQHAFSTSTVGDHQHSIALDGQHAHGIASVGDHSHGLTIDAAGSGAAHSNMPPGLVVVFAIKA